MTATTTRSRTPRSRSWSTTTSRPVERLADQRRALAERDRPPDRLRGPRRRRTTTAQRVERVRRASRPAAAGRPAGRAPRPGGPRGASAPGATGPSGPGRPRVGACPRRGTRGTGSAGRAARPRGRAVVGQRRRGLDPVPRQHRPRLDQDQLARDRHERRHVAHPVAVERREGVEVRVGERAERHREDVELAGLDQGQQQAERPVERGQRDERRRLGRRPSPNATDGEWRASSSAGLVRGLEQPAVTPGPADPPGGGQARRLRREPDGLRPGTAEASAWCRAGRARRPNRAATRRDAPDPRPERLAQRPRDARPGARVALGAVVEQARHEHVAVGHAGARSHATTARPWRRSATCWASNRAAPGAWSRPPASSAPPGSRSPQVHPELARLTAPMRKGRPRR